MRSVFHCQWRKRSFQCRFSVLKNPNCVFVSKLFEAFKADLKVYLLLHNELSRKPFHSWANLYMTLMSRLARHYPELDLKTLSRNDIFANDLPCKSVSAAVQAGLLSPVPGWEVWVAEI